MKPWRALANEYRNLPLDIVLDRLGAYQDKHDRQKWITPTGKVWVGTGNAANKFYDHKANIGGGGAIDLVQHVLNIGFIESIEWLEQNCSSKSVSHPRTTSDTRGNAGKFVPPKPVSAYSAIVADYLTCARGLPKALIDKYMCAGKIYADAHRNAVFLCKQDGQITGAEVRGTSSIPYKGMAVGSKRGVGFFTMPHPNPTRLVIVESAIDALSYHTLHSNNHNWIISTAGVLTSCPRIPEIARINEIEEIVVAYDSDDAGDFASDQLMASLSESQLLIRRHTPSHKDWNDTLLQQNSEGWAA